jgi:hypothetical protein
MMMTRILRAINESATEPPSCAGFFLHVLHVMFSAPGGQQVSAACISHVVLTFSWVMGWG